MNQDGRSITLIDLLDEPNLAVGGDEPFHCWRKTAAKVSSSVLLKNASLPVLRLIGALRWSVKGGSVMAAEGGKYRRWRLHHGSGRWQVSLGYHVSNQRIRGKSEQRSLRAWEREQILKRKENSLRNGIETRVNSKIGDKTTTAYL